MNMPAILSHVKLWVKVIIAKERKKIKFNTAIYIMTASNFNNVYVIHLNSNLLLSVVTESPNV